MNDDRDDLDGHTIEELSDYLDAGRKPYDPSIENSPGCRIALDALVRLRSTSQLLLEAEATLEPEPDESWIGGILQNIGREARAGRRIPLSHPDPVADLGITEGSVRGLVRAASDTVDGLIVGRTALQGDVTTPGEPITVSIDATVYLGHSIPETTASLRERVATALATHTELVIEAIDITVHDVHPDPAAAPEENR
ncbi:Asp23/Gls24 family envelope stress response protein [Herbiconiux sp. P15]|uniref:Asp23/Gls24 family envelope stress response protein n=1 Tax=Herbiconiux liukaitaii TaxID=3342799 RepID=UPI0035B94DA5